MSIIGKFDGDNLIATNAHVLTSETVVVKAGEKVSTMASVAIPRGTVLARNSADKFIVLGSDTGTAEVVAATDIEEVSDDTVAEVYNSGDFNGNALIAAENYSITAGDVADLKKAGVYVVNEVAPKIITFGV